ncbi:MAG: GDSL-type esterase/lipase family protein, partial [Dialister sp.]|nr:GDSL-type esterase/lipase family protein [Dialister sp.]
VYTNSLMLDMRQWQAEKPLFYRVRAYDLDGHPIGPYSQPADVESALFKTERNAPIPHDSYGKGNGSVLLYPVYAYTGNPNAARYEIEVTSKYPENLHGFSPSVHRIYAAKTELTDLYDDAPRTGTYYWRVRGMDSTGKPVGEWSLPQEIKNPVKHWKVAVYGDSISHGGGHLSFGPADLAYSYESYLDFPSINLSQSGDTSEAMVMRFEKDVLPFSPEYLLILGGTNSLRAGVPAADVISDLKEIQRKCREHGITPILMTLPPINPENIQKAFHEPTYEGWKDSFDEVNAFIRGEVHIDTAAPFEKMEELPTWLALDGIHGDWNMKRMMAEVINREFPKVAAGD